MLARAATGHDDRLAGARRLPDRAASRPAAPSRSGNRSTMRPAIDGSAAIMSVMWYGGPARGLGAVVDAHGIGRGPSGAVGSKSVPIVGVMSATIGRLMGARARGRRAPPRSRRAHPAPCTKESSADAGWSHCPAGLEGRVRRLGPRRGVGAHGRAGPGTPKTSGSSRSGSSTTSHRARADRRDHLRVVLDALRPGDGHRSRPARPHGRLHRIPQPRPHREARLDDRRHQRRPLRARHRGRLEGGRVAGLRLRVPAHGRTARRPG